MSFIVSAYKIFTQSYVVMQLSVLNVCLNCCNCIMCYFLAIVLLAAQHI